MSHNLRKNIWRKKRIAKRLRKVMARFWFRKIDQRLLNKMMHAEWENLREQQPFFHMMKRNNP